MKNWNLEKIKWREAIVELLLLSTKMEGRARFSKQTS